MKNGIPLRDWTFGQHWQDWYDRQLRKGCWSEARKKWHLNYFKRYFSAYFRGPPPQGDQRYYRRSLLGVANRVLDEWKLGKQLRIYNPKRRAAKSRTTLNAKAVLRKPSLSEVMKLNSEPPHIPENDVVSRDLIAARDLVKALIAKLQK